jgi:hypothetical protein
MKLLLIALISSIAMESLAQRTIDITKNDVSATAPNMMMVVGGEPFVLYKFTRLVNGTPYFSDNWMKGNVVINGGGSSNQGLSLKLDLVDNKVHFKDPKGVEMVATTIIQKITLFDSITQEVFQFINSDFIQATPAPDAGWYQSLWEGNVSLFKKYHKAVQENKPYNSATIEHTIQTIPRYFVLYKNVFILIKKIKNIPEIFPDKKQELLKFIQDNKLSEKNEADIVRVIAQYNLLIGGK